MAVCLSVQAQSSPSESPKKISKIKTGDAPRLAEARGRRYRLNPGDVLEIIYRYTPEFNQTVTIHPDGFIVLEIVGEVEVGGLTLEETRQKLIKKATLRLKDPEITLLLKEFQKPYYIVSGEVSKPGKFEMNEQITALQAVMMAGGFRDSAKVSQVFIFRKINKEFAEVRMLDLKKIKKTSDLEKDLNLESGDIIFVPRNKFSKFEKYIRLTSLGSILNPILR
jgi:polysaccharide export outer membrane protein